MMSGIALISVLISERGGSRDPPVVDLFTVESNPCGTISGGMLSPIG